MPSSLGIPQLDVGKIDDELINYSDQQSMNQESRQLPRNRKKFQINQDHSNEDKNLEFKRSKAPKFK